jgi:hypothetical protein
MGSEDIEETRPGGAQPGLLVSLDRIPGSGRFWVRAPRLSRCYG